jgi:hypothetical protein
MAATRGNNHGEVVEIGNRIEITCEKSKVKEIERCRL